MRKYIITLLLLPMLASAQYFEVFDIDTSEYPIMKAKFYSIDANGNQILNHSPADFEITENGEPRDVISVSCPEPKNEPFSVVIAVDVSGSMKGEELSTLKNSLNYFIDLVPNDGSEICIIAFNSSNYFISDFSTNKSKLKSKVDDLSAGGGTNFDAAFINPIAGALLAIEKAMHSNKNVIIVTDGKASGNENEIINKAKSLGTRIFGILIKNKAPNILQNIFESTQGKGFENIITQSDFNKAFINVRNEILGGPCEIIWESKVLCDIKIDTEIYNQKIGLNKAFSLSLNDSQYLPLEIDKYFINFGTSSKDTTITIISKSGAQTINEIIFEPDNSNYEVLTPLPINIPKNDSVEIEIRFSPIDDAKEYTTMEIIGDYCNTSLGLFKGDKNKPLIQRTLELTHPNGGEVFVAGTDTIIIWEGITKNEKVKLNFSSDNGKNWNQITDKATDNEYKWKVPNLISDSCLIYVDQYVKNSNMRQEDLTKIEWTSIFGGSSGENVKSVIQSNDGGFVVVGYSQSNDGDLDTLNLKGVNDVLVIKYYPNGMLEWAKTFGGSENEQANSVIETFDGGLVIVGETSSNNGDFKGLGTNAPYNIFIMKITSLGNLVWFNKLTSTDIVETNHVIQSIDGGLLVTGYNQNIINGIFESSSPAGGRNTYVLKLSNNGELEWLKYFGGNKSELATSIIQLSEGGIILVGRTSSVNGDFKNTINKGKTDLFIMKITKEGNLEWAKTYGGSDDEEASSVIETSDGGYLVTGYTLSSDGDLKFNFGNTDMLIFKVTKDGDLEWTRTIGGSGYEQARAAILLTDGSYLITGSTSSDDYDFKTTESLGASDGVIIKVDSDGELEWIERYGGISGDAIESFAFTDEGSIVCTGLSNSFISKGNPSPYNNIWTFKLAPPQPLQSDTSDAVFSIIMPEPVINVTDIDMGQMIVGNTKDSTVSSVICNNGDAPLHVLGVDITGGDNSDFLIPRGAGDFYLEKDSCQDMMFEFTPSALGNRKAVATIRTTIGDFTDTITIHGVGIDPLIEATSEVVDFGVFELGNGKDTTVVLVKNVGSTDITITDTRISGPDMEQFTLNTNPVTYTIPAGQEKEFELNYTAKYGGRTSSILEFHYNGVGSPLRSMLFAEGVGGEVLPQVPDAYVGETVELGVFLGKIKPEGLKEVATKFSATVSYNSTLLAPIDKSMNVTTDGNTSFLKIEGELSEVSQIAAIPMKVGLGTAVKSGLLITEFQLYDADGDSVDYDIEPGVSEFNVLGICEEGGTRLLNPTGEVVLIKLQPNSTATQTTAELTLIEEGQTELSIYDVAGNRLKTLFTGIPQPGTKTIDIDTSEFQSGRYYVRLTTPTITKTEILEVVR